MADKKFIFHKDQFGVVVYYMGMNPNEPRLLSLEFKINNKTDFDPSKTCVVPLVTRISTTSIETQATGYQHDDGFTTLSVTSYNAKLKALETDVMNAVTDGDVTKEVAAQVALRYLQDHWAVQTEEVDVYKDYDFEIIDIEYPADERLIPLRHLDEVKINYFKVDGELVAKNLIHQLCQEAGLEQKTCGIRCYGFAGYNNDVYSWRIEGVTYGAPLGKLTLSNFTGHLQDCRVYINEIEAVVRQCFDEWLISGKTSKGLSVKFLIDHLKTIELQVNYIQSKIKTQQYHTGAKNAIALAKAEIEAIGAQELIDGQENSDEEFDNDEDIE